MSAKYVDIIRAKKQDSFLDALHALQEMNGYITQEAIEVLSEEFGATPAKIYESASFYSMIRFAPQSEFTIQICRSAPCHVAGVGDVICALEESLGIKMGEVTMDGRVRLEYVECLGQCQDSPSLLVNGVLHTQINVEKALELIGKGRCS